MSGNNRINYACLALAYCKEKPIDGVKSVGFSVSRNIVNVYGRGKSTPAATYGELPNIEFSYSSHVVSGVNGFPGFDKEKGLSDFVSFDMIIGSETNSVLTTPTGTMRLSYLLLNNVTYNLTVDGLFSIDRTFQGWGKSSNCAQSLGRPSGSSGVVLTRSAFSEQNSILPSFMSDCAIQNINISMDIKRSIVGEFATRRPYASYITFPIETTCTIDAYIRNSLDNFDFDLLQNACSNSKYYTQNLKIATCAGSQPILIDKAYLSSFNYSGAEAAAGSENLKISVTYVGYQPPSDINPVVYLDKVSNNPCDC